MGTTARTGKHTVKPATGGYNGLVVVACDNNAENCDQDADELDGGFGGPCHDWLRILGDCVAAIERGQMIMFHGLNWIDGYRF